MKPTSKGASTPQTSGGTSVPDAAALTRRHLRFGWWSLLVFLSLGIVLESLHAFKVGWYLNVSSETRRLLLTLAHAHGTLLALVNLGFAVTLPLVSTWEPRLRRFAGTCLLTASLLIPAGFFLGGIGFHAGDAGVGILLVPTGAVFLLVAVFLTAAALRSKGKGN